jgi:multiple sugar transport system permease protein
MTATAQPLKTDEAAGGVGRFPPVLWFVIAWQLIVAASLGVLAFTLFQETAFFNLGAFVPQFLGVVSLVAAGAFVLSAVLIAMRRYGGRLIGVVGGFAGFGLALILLGQIIGAYTGVDQLSYSLFDHAALLLGIPIGYAVYWLGRRLMPEDTPGRKWSQRIGFGLIGATLAAILLTSGFPGQLISDPAAALAQVVTAESLAALGAAALFFISATILVRSGDAFGETILQREAWQGWLFLLPNFLSFVLFFALPLVLSFYLSFTDYNAISQAEPVGLDNYVRLLSLDAALVPAGVDAATLLRPNHFALFSIPVGDQTFVLAARDPLFWQSLWTTVRYVILLLLFSVVPAFGLAMVLNSKIPGMTFFRAAYFLPSIAAVVGISMIWAWLYDPVIGYVNYTILQIINFLNGLFGTTIADPKINWLTDENVMIFSVTIMAAWQVIGFNAVIILAGLQGIQRDLVEAATVDGAGAWTRFRKIILPLLAPTTFFVVVTTLIAGLQAFSEMYTLFGNSTSNARLTVVFYLYQQGFQRFQMGYASATAWVLFAVIFIITIIQFRLSSRSKAYSD